MRSLLRAIGTVVLFLSVSFPGLAAQLDRGSLSGTITDSSGAIVGGATVTATHTTSGRVLTTVSTDAGLYASPTSTWDRTL